MQQVRLFVTNYRRSLDRSKQEAVEKERKGLLAGEFFYRESCGLIFKLLYPSSAPASHRGGIGDPGIPVSIRSEPIRGEDHRLVSIRRLPCPGDHSMAVADSNASRSFSRKHRRPIGQPSRSNRTKEYFQQGRVKQSQRPFGISPVEATQPAYPHLRLFLSTTGNSTTNSGSYSQSLWPNDIRLTRSPYYR